MRADFHGAPFVDAVMAPTRIYVKPMLALIGAMPVKGIAHITGGGLVENVPRVLPQGCQAVLHRDAWTMPPLFGWLQREGAIADAEMHRVFNCGIGLVVVVAAADADAAIARLRAAGETVARIGEILERPAGAPPTVVC
jgi:phosphoribosylformylglycinamidine cyclo-ligase